MDFRYGITRQSRRAIQACLLLMIVLAGAFALSALSLQAAPEGGTVGSGTPASCTEAALDAKLVGGGNLAFDCGPNAYTLTITSQKVITLNTVINGGGKITLNGNNSTKIFVVNSGRSLKLTNITLANGRSALGGCVLVLGSITAFDSTFRGCHGVDISIFPGSGGALAAFGTSLTLSNTQILNNVADVDGGGIYLATGVANMENVSVISNRANLTYTNSGGGIYVASGALLTMTNSQVSSNLFGYTGQGGGIAAYSTTIRLSSVVLSNNHGANAGDGGGLYLQNVTATLASLSISGNDHLYAGGGISAQQSRVTLSNSDISGNTASSNGGGIATYKGTLNLSAVSISGNLVTSDGGGIDLYDTPANLANVTVSNNRGGRNGGGINNYLNTLTLNNSTFSGNVSDYSGSGDGGAIYNAGLLVATSSTFDHNVAAQLGGGLFNASDATSSLSNVTLSANTAITGGGVYNEAGFTQPAVVTLTNVTLRDNSATDGGGTYNAVDVHNFFFLKNTIIADSPSGGNCKGKAFTASKYSLATDGTCALSGVGNHNAVPVPLNPLANNGGPTRTHLPKPGPNVVVDGVSGSDCPSVDQRGVSRPQGISCDIGAVERQLSDPALSPALWLPIIVR